MPEIEQSWSTGYSKQWNWNWRPSTRKGWLALTTGSLLFAGILVAAILTVIQTSFRNSEPYKVAVARAEHHPLVTGKLGTPVVAGRFTGGSLNTNNNTADCDLLVPVRGPSGAGKVHVVARKYDGIWHYSEMQFLADQNGETVDLIEDADPR